MARISIPLSWSPWNCMIFLLFCSMQRSNIVMKSRWWTRRKTSVRIRNCDRLTVTFDYLMSATTSFNYAENLKGFTVLSANIALLFRIFQSPGGYLVLYCYTTLSMWSLFCYIEYVKSKFEFSVSLSCFIGFSIES